MPEGGDPKDGLRPASLPQKGGNGTKSVPQRGNETMPDVATGRPGAVSRARQAADNLVRKLQRRARLLEQNLGGAMAEAVEELTGPMGPELRKRVVAVIPHLARQLAAR